MNLKMKFLQTCMNCIQRKVILLSVERTVFGVEISLTKQLNKI